MLNTVKKMLEERESHFTEARGFGADSNRENNERWKFCHDKVATVQLCGMLSFPVRIKSSHSLSFSTEGLRESCLAKSRLANGSDSPSYWWWGSLTKNVEENEIQYAALWQFVVHT